MGTPTILIQDGKILEGNLRKVKFDINDLLEEIRIAGYFDLSQVEYAIMEANGTVSVLPKSNYRALTPNDMKVKVEKEGLCSNVIIDGKIMYNNLSGINKDESWLKKQLKISGYNNISDILLETINIDKKIVVYKKNKEIKTKDVLE